MLMLFHLISSYGIFLLFLMCMKNLLNCKLEHVVGLPVILQGNKSFRVGEDVPYLFLGNKILIQIPGHKNNTFGLNEIILLTFL